MNRIFFDSNAGNDQIGYVLWFDRSKEDIRRIDGGAHEGMIVTLYMPDEIEIGASLKYDDDLGCWRGIPLAV